VVQNGVFTVVVDTVDWFVDSSSSVAFIDTIALVQAHRIRPATKARDILESTAR